MNIFIIENTELGSHRPLSVFLTDLLESFRSLNSKFRINAIVAQSDQLPEKIIKQTENIYQLPTSTYSMIDSLKFSYLALLRLVKANSQRKIDIIHCLYPNSSLLAAIVFKILINKKTKIIYEVRSPWIRMSAERGNIHPRFLEKLITFILNVEELFLVKFVDHFIFITSGLASYYQSSYRISKNLNSIIPKGIDIKKFKYIATSTRNRHKIDRDAIVLGMIGVIARMRKLEFVLEAFAELVKKQPRYRLMLVGDGEVLPELKKAVEKLKIENKVIFTGIIPHHHAPYCISGFDIGLCHLPDTFVFRHSYPLKILEYIACGIPVLASNIKAHREIRKEFKNIYLYNFSKADFIKKVKQITHTKPFPGNNQKLKEGYSLTATAGKYQSVYEKFEYYS